VGSHIGDAHLFPFLLEYCLHIAGASRPPAMIPKGSSSEDLVPTSRPCAMRADLSRQLRSVRDRLTDTGFAEANATRRNQHVIGAQPQVPFDIAWFVVAYPFSRPEMRWICSCHPPSDALVISSAHEPNFQITLPNRLSTRETRAWRVARYLILSGTIRCRSQGHRCSKSVLERTDPTEK
jgi:hypothetical protein